MADTTINLLSELSAVAADDKVPVWDTSAGQYMWIQRSNLVGATLTGAGTIATAGFTLTIPATGTAALISNSTWVPELRFGGNTGCSYTARNGYYYRIGDAVLIAGSILLSAVGSATGNATISGLPVANYNNTGQVSSFPFFYFGMTATLVNMVGTIAAGAQVISLYGATAAATGVSALTHASFGASSILYFSGLYFAA